MATENTPPFEQSPEFKKAVEDSRKLKAKPTQNEMLDLYALFKQGSQDPPIDKATKPGMFDMVNKEKRKAWDRLIEKGTTPEQAQQEYVKYVESMKEKYGFEGPAAPAAEAPSLASPSLDTPATDTPMTPAATPQT